MARLYILLFLVQVVLAVCALISCLSAEEDGIRHLPRIAWLLIILFFPLVGSIAWFVAGRERKPVGGSTSWAPGARPAERHRPVAPDDDPEFLRSIEERSRREDQELFRRWEEDLRKREDDLRRREGEPPREEPRPEV
ncbi:PLD nuclease N-terminal domain-containing protein [Verrucosispora sp. WMMA2044]|uniref:PLDc_N domain-containing protein n=1 Tax=Verrucosispora sioxanthis TaxID=2499994 RepID=A0A6M1KTD6_9ACTN|nr:MULTISPECIES: PLD nuclease N-terminal domain-containing protein [Micromonospora]NEE62866.1 PLDc_N domain-containing protein [Verrucosispora sioxanthis]NGM11976.1 PLDc_N domain-containing protein [Verrucosispora sioxanthis]WBB47239.1 PLD nuclease N-terminal domain-containing protein [Verrucosispora sp. WMMA2044]